MIPILRREKYAICAGYLASSWLLFFYHVIWDDMSGQDSAADAELGLAESEKALSESHSRDDP